MMLAEPVTTPKNWRNGMNSISGLTIGCGNKPPDRLCHCEYCRKDSGSAHTANLFSSTATLKWLSGANNVKQFNLPATRHSKCFCSTCGSALPIKRMNGDLLVVPAGSLDSEVHLRPNAHIFVASRAGWDDSLERIPAVDRFPS
jgi:hypothetical protein